MRTPALNAVNRKGTSHVPHPHGVIAWAGTETKSFVCWARHDLPRLWYEIPLSVSVSVSVSLSLSLSLLTSLFRSLARLVLRCPGSSYHVKLWPPNKSRCSLRRTCFHFFFCYTFDFPGWPFRLLFLFQNRQQQQQQKLRHWFPPHSSFPCVRCR